MKSPTSYYGSKTALLKDVLRMFPGVKSYHHYNELFFGSGLLYNLCFY